MRRRQPVVDVEDLDVPLWVQTSPRFSRDGIHPAEVLDLPGCPEFDALVESEPWGPMWAHLFEVRAFAAEAARAWAVEHGLILSAAHCGHAVAGPVDAHWSPQSGVDA